MDAPFSVRPNERTGLLCLAVMAIYAIFVYCYEVEKQSKRPGEEYGSAKWGRAKALNQKYADENDPYHNIILTQNLRVSMNARKHKKNLNVLAVGGSSSGKTRFFAKPNLMQTDGKTSYIVCDPKGEILRAVGPLLEKEGYEITVFDLINYQGHFNPFVYLRNDKDALKLVSNLIRNTTPKGSNTNDPFWDRAETALLTALILYLKSQAKPEEQNFSTIMMLLAGAEIKEEDENHKSPLDLIFEALEEKDPHSVAVKQYRIFKQAAGVVS